MLGLQARNLEQQERVFKNQIKVNNKPLIAPMVIVMVILSSSSASILLVEHARDSSGRA
jgi:hypothetical protein